MQRTRSRLGRSALLVVVPCLLAGCGGGERPNILLVVADTARADRFSSNGYGRDTTKVIAALGREGAVYLQARSPSPWTLPAHASLFTGLYPSGHGADSGHLRLDDRLPFLALRLRAAGYKTLAYVENPWVGKDYNFQPGFDTFDEVWRGVHGTEGDMGAAVVSEKVERWLAWRDGNPDARAQPFFLFVNYFEPHLPYNPPEPERSRFLRASADASAVDRLRRFKHPQEVRQIVGRGVLTADDLGVLSDLYDGEIAYVDRRVGELIGSLRSRGLLDRTVVVVTSDHGEMLGEHGLVDHKLTLHEQVLRIPLILRFPPAVAAGQRIESPVLLQDLYPTLLHLAGAVTVPEGPASVVNGSPAEHASPWPSTARPLPGVRGLEAGPPRGSTDEDPLIAEYARPGEFLEVLKEVAPELDPAPYNRTQVAVLARGWKLIWGSDGRHRLFDLGADPAESVDLSATRAELTKRVAGQAADWLIRADAMPPVGGPASPASQPAPGRH